MRKEKRQGVKKIIITLIVLLLCFGVLKHFIFDKNRINKNQIDTTMYIDTADEVSKGKLQVNWKYLAAIDAVRYDNDFTKANKESLKVLGNKFIVKKNNQYKLKKLVEVLDEISFDKDKKEKVYSYLDDLKYIGLVSKNLKDNSLNKKFVNKLEDEAVGIYKKYKILPSVIIAQAILESNWGRSKLATEGNNLFGIKADKSWTGKTVTMKTKEYYEKVITDKFRAYSDLDNCLKDYAKFLSENQRYTKNGVFLATHYIKQAQALEDSGYSTVQNKKGENIYADMLIDIIKQNDLQIIDNQVEMNITS